jgi:hypothetical protein
MTQNDNDKTVNRRKFLRNTGIAVGALATTALPAEAKMTQEEQSIQKDHETHNRLLRERRKNEWTLQEFCNEVEKSGSEAQISIATVELTDEGGQKIKSVAHSEVDTRSNGEITPQYHIPRGDMSLEVDVITGANADTAALSWTWTTDFRTGQDPWDYALMGWSNNHYLYDGYVENPHAHPNSMYLWKRDPTGSIVRFGDAGAAPIQGGETDTAAYSVNLIRQTPGEKMVYASYHHTWNNVDISSVGFGASGPVISFSNSSKEWHIRDRQGSHYNG